VTEKNCMTQCVKASICVDVNNSHQEHRPFASSIMYARTNTIFKVEAGSRVAMSGNWLFIKEGKRIALENKDANYTFIWTFVDIKTQIGEEIDSYRIP
jgi:hypothetical protein